MIKSISMINHNQFFIEDNDDERFPAKTETKRVVEETDEMIKNKAELLSRIFEKQKRNVSLEADSFNLLQVSADFLMMFTIEVLDC